MKTVKFISRLIVCPLIFGLMIIGAIRDSFYMVYLFIRYGGEFVTFRDKYNRNTISCKLDKLIEEKGQK